MLPVLKILDMSRTPPHLVTHFLRLGLSPSANRAEISAAYRAAALKHHPDRGGSAPEFAAITDSYHKLIRGTNQRFYRPASLRSFVDSQASEPSPFAGIFTAVVLPSLIGIFVGVRFVYFGGEREGLRAGGVSRFIPDDMSLRTNKKKRDEN